MKTEQFREALRIKNEMQRIQKELHNLEDLRFCENVEIHLHGQNGNSADTITPKMQMTRRTRDKLLMEMISERVKKMSELESEFKEI